MPELLIKVTTREITHWLRDRQPNLTVVATEVATRRDWGLEKNRREYQGEFTGTGLCNVVVAAQEQALIGEFGDDVNTQPLFLYAKRRDIETYDNPPQPRKGHWILAYRARGEQECAVADPTFRQLQITTNPHKMLIGFPERQIPRIYGAFFIPGAVEGGGALNAAILQGIEVGITPVEVTDYQELIKAL